MRHNLTEYCSDDELAIRASHPEHDPVSGWQFLATGDSDTVLFYVLADKVRGTMQWILQRFEDTGKLADALDRLGIAYTWHKVVPFIGELVPEPEVADPDQVVLFGSYSLWRYADAKGFRPGVFKLRPFVQEQAWHPFLLNGADALFLTLRDVPGKLPDDERQWFIRPVDDSKEEPGNVKTSGEIIKLAEQVLSLDEAEIPNGSLRHDTQLMLTEPVHILKEWRLWVVDEHVVT